MPSGGGLGIQAGEIWAYRAGQRTPLQPAKVVDPGEHYDASIRIRLVDDPGHAEKWVRRIKLPCRWHEAGDWLDQHPEAWPVEYQEPVPQPGANDRIVVTLAALRRVVREEVAAVLDEGRVAYTIADFAAVTGYGRTTIDEAIARGDLVASYANKKGVIDVDEGRRWIKSLPHEPPR